MDLQIGISAEARHALGVLLSALLGDEYVLMTKTRKYHWLVTGPHFKELHAFFEEQYGILAEIVDEVAERSLMLGVRPPATLGEFLAVTRLTEVADDTLNATEMVRSLRADHEQLIRQLRLDLAEAVDTHGDAGTSDFLTGLLEQHEKMAWMLRATAG